MNLKYLLMLVGVVSIASCKKDDKPAVIVVNVKSLSGDALSGVIVKLLSDQHHDPTHNYLTATSGNDGKIMFTVQPGSDYYLYHYDEDHRWIADPTATFIITGKFTTQQQINSSPGQTPSAQIGDDIQLDVNGDGIVDKYDEVIKVPAPKAGITTTQNFILTQ